MKRLTQEDFLEKANSTHGGKYDYSKSFYKNARTKVEIICPKHGSFWQLPSLHLNGCGCTKCSGKEQYTQETFAIQANIVHNNKYDYSKVEYINNHTKICIICPEHGEFWQLPVHHLRGSGCPECYFNLKRKSTSEFIERSKQIHGDKYDYSKVEYINNHTKICIICPEHGEFWQTPESHLSGSGCFKCGNKIPSVLEFIERSKQIHGDKYDYSKTEYVNSQAKVCIICPKHGEFWQLPSDHLLGHGCQKCAIELIISKRRLGSDDFIERSKQIHGDKYDYSKVEYVNSQTKVCIICPIHGEFWQTPNTHLHKCGCPKCGKESAALKQTIKYNEFLDRAIKIHGDKYRYVEDGYVNLSSKIKIICPKHGEFQQVAERHLHGFGCPCCSESAGETKIRVFLENEVKTNFVFQYRSKWLGRQSIDFFFPEYKFGIEFDGIQHFKPVNWTGCLAEEEALKNFNMYVENDRVKDAKCIANGIKLYRIKYNDNIEEKLTKILKENKIDIRR